MGLYSHTHARARARAPRDIGLKLSSHNKFDCVSNSAADAPVKFHNDRIS